MVQMIKGETVTLQVNTASTEVDDFGQPIFTESTVNVDNVLIGEPSSEDITSEIALSGKRIAYTLAIPSEDTNNWENTLVTIRGRVYRTIGIPTEYTDGNMPSWFPWNKKIKVEAYE